MEKIYLDYAATTPVDPQVLQAMQPYFSAKFGNPGSLHSFGQEAIAALDVSRETIANAIGANFREVIFTSSATEANNLALRGVVSQLKTTNYQLKTRIIVSAIEHESVLETARDLEQWGVEVIYLPVLKNGLADLKKFKSSLNENTALVSIMYANNETGAIQPISEISKIILNFRESLKSHKLQATSYPLFHTDASQSFQYLNGNVNDLGVDLMTVSSHKIYGPKGVGCLYIRNSPQTANYKLQASLTGGHQEFGLRSGTENVPAIVGFAKAVELAIDHKLTATSSAAKLRDYLWLGIKKIHPKAQLNGDSKNRLPNILNVYWPGINAEEFLIKLDLVGVAASTGSACKARALESSRVLAAMGYNEKRAKNSLRFSLGRYTTKEELDSVLKVLKRKSR